MNEPLTECRPTTNHDCDSGICCFSPSSSITPLDSRTDLGYMDDEAFGDAETCKSLIMFTLTKVRGLN